MKNSSLALLVFVLTLFSSNIFSQTTFTGDNTGAPINGFGTVESRANSNLTGTIGTDYVIDSVKIDINHFNDGDLEIKLESPNGTILDLSIGNGDFEEDYTNTVFQDGGADITQASAPFTGIFEPQGGTFASTFDGEFVSGDWKLLIDDTDDLINDGTFNNFEITFAETSCIKPANLTASNITLFSSDLSWDPVGNANSYEYVVMQSGDAPDPFNAVATNPFWNATNVSVSGLNSGTVYDAYVRSNCGGGNKSDWSNVVTFTTLCPILSAPLTENFDGANFDAGNNTIDDCWARTDDSSGYEWEVGDDNGTPSSNTGPNDDISGSGNFLFTEATSGSTGSEAFLNTPEIDLSPLTTPRMKISYHMFGDNMGTFNVEVKEVSALSYNTEFTISGEQQTAEGDPFIEETIDLSAYAGQTVYIRFTGERGSNFESDIAIDEFIVEESPSCVPPSNLNSSNITSTDVDLDWDASPSTVNNGYDWEIVPAGNNQGSGVVASGTTANTSVTATGLSVNNAYDVFVRANCGGGDKSAFTNPLSFTTLICTQLTTPYSENFDTVSQTFPFFPDCWSRAGVFAEQVGVETSDLGVDDPPSSPNFAFFGADSNFENSIEALLVSPPFSDLQDADNRIRFKAAFENGQFETRKLFVGVMSDPTDVSTFEVQGVIQTTPSTPDGGFQEYTVNLDNPSSIGSSKYIAIAADLNTSGLSINNTSIAALDDFVYEEIPSCLAPGNLANTAVSLTTADFSWNAVGNANNGYEYVVMPSGDAPDTSTAVDTGTIASGTTTVQASGLTADTDYDFYVRADCGGGDISSWSNLVSFFTGYCDSTPSSNDGDGISQIDFNGNVIPSGGDNVTYEDFTSTTVDIQQAVTANLDITFETGFAYDTNIWIDFNDNKLFEASELVFQGESTFNNPTTLDASFPVDVAANLGNHRMRIGTAFILEQDTPEPCYTGAAGVTIDVTVNVTAAPSCIIPDNLSVSNITATAADLDWDTEGTASSYDWEIVPQGDGQGNNVVASGNVTGTSVAVTSLSSNTDYDAYIRSDCGSGDKSNWSGAVSFTTPCSIFNTFPFNEDFEDSSTSLRCWSQIQEVGFADWTFDQGSSGGNITSANNGTKNARFVSQSGNSNLITKLVSPVFDLTSLTNPELSFFYAQESWGSDQNELKVYYRVDDQSAWVEIAHFTDNIDNWTEESLILPNPSAAYQIAFEGINNHGRANVIDDVEIKEGPSCITPENLSASIITDTTADLDWNSEGTASSYDWEIVPQGDGQGNNVVDSGNLTGTSVSVTSLSSNTDYDAYVRSDCGNGDKSEWSGAVSFSTFADGDICIDPFSLSVTTDDTNITSLSTSNANGSPLENNLDCDSFGTNYGLWYSFTAPSETLEFDSRTGGPGITIFEGSDCNSLTEVTNGCLDNTDGTITGLTTGNQYYALVWTDSQIANVEFSLYYITCPAPSNFTNTAVTATTADFSWDSVSSASNGYDYFVTSNSTVPDENTAPTGSVASGTTATLSGLMSQTNYDAYVRSDCGGDISEWSSPVSFTTQPDFCAGDNFFDNGGSSGNYLNNSNETTVISPDNPGDLVSVEFLSFNTENSYDGLVIYDGPDDTAPLIDSGGTGFNNLPDGAWTGTGATSANGKTFTSSHSSGALTFVFISDGSANESGWEADVTCAPPPTCITPENLSISDITTTAADLDWNSEGTASSYDWEIVPQGDGQGNNVVDSGNLTGTSVSVTSLSSNTDYDAYVRSDCGNGDKSVWSSAVSFTTSFVNDDACNATALTIDATSAGNAFTNVGATPQMNEPDTNLDGGVDASVWFTFVAPAYGNVQVTTDIAGGTLTDTEVAVYSVGDCSDFSTYTQIGFNQDGGTTVSFNSVLNLYDLNMGETYYVQVDRWNTASDGTFGIEVLDLSYVYNGTAWSPQVPGGNATDINNLIVESGTAPFVSNTTANEVMVQAGAVLNLNADLTGDVTFKSDNTGTAQLADATGNSITGDVTVERFIPVATEDTRAFRFLTSAVNSNDPIKANWQEGVNNTGTAFPADNENPNPGFGTHITGSTTGSNGFDASISGNPSMYTFDNSFIGNQSNSWNAIPNTNSRKLNAGEAYRIFIRGDRGYDLTANENDAGFAPNNDVTLRATGSLAIGDQTETLSDVGGYYSLIGNPYQANVNINNITGSNFNPNAYYVWDPNMSTRGAYVTVPLPGGIPAGTSDANQFVQPGQSFFVQTLNDGTADLTFSESAKDVNAILTDVFSDNDQTSINLLLYTDQALNNNDSETDALGINFNPNGNNAVDQMDAGKMGNPDENLARLNNGEYISIENRAMPVDGESLELYTVGYTSSNYTFVANVSNLPDDVEAYIVDNYTGDQTLLSDGANQISFTVDSSIPGSIAADRFSLDFEIETFGNEEIAQNQLTIYPNPVTDEKLNIVSSDRSGEANVSLYNMVGQRVLKTKGDFEAGKMTLNLGSQQAGVYFLEVTQNEETIKKRLIIKH